MYCNGLKWAVLGSTGLYWEVLGYNWAKLCWTVVDCGEPMPLSISDRIPSKEKDGEEAIFSQLYYKMTRKVLLFISKGYDE